MAKSTAKADQGFEAALSYVLQSIRKGGLVVREAQKEAMIYLLASINRFATSACFSYSTLGWDVPVGLIVVVR